jgi:hypothetical protein
LVLAFGWEANAQPVTLGTVAINAKDGDAVVCCATNQGLNDLSLLGVAAFDVAGAILPLTPFDPAGPSGFPTALGPKQTRCYHLETPRSTPYRCEIIGEGAGAQQDLAGSLMIVVISGDPNRVHAVVEAHPISGTNVYFQSTRPCGETFPQCNGACPPNEFCNRSDARGSCWCGTR